LDSAEQILSFQQSRDSTIRKMVITMIPTLAVYDTQTFVEHYLHRAMAHLLTQLEKPNERTFGLCLSLGDSLLSLIYLARSIHCNRAHCYRCG
jgi:hypothetical protein